MSLYQSVLKPLLFQFDPEKAHERAMKLLRLGILKVNRFDHPALKQEVFGTVFHNPLGLAAGFDKNAAALEHWHQMGFGFAEIGTVTAQPQPGNEKPRLFRLPQDEALINRMGFNNDGARAIATRVASAQAKIPVGINLGKTKVVPLENAPADYAESYRLLHNFGQYFVINVSSPNTPGLRDLQGTTQLREIIQAMQAVDATRPLLVKLAPDLELAELDDIIALAHDTKLAGIVATNTTLSRNGVSSLTEETGGLSGRPLRIPANKYMRHLYGACDKSMVLIGVGGIMNGDDLFDRIASGATLCQIYTGWVYGGPQMVPTALERLVDLMNERGHGSLAELRGSAA